MNGTDNRRNGKRVIRDRTIVADTWRLELDAGDADAIAPGDVIVSLDLWRRESERLLARGTRIGVRLAPDDDAGALAGPTLHELSLVDLEFTSFADGRGYSQARLLRSRHGFRDDIRASGDISRDRVALMERCGVNEFALPDGRDPDDALAAFDEIGVHYQTASDGAVPAAELRGLRRRRGVSHAA